MNRSDVVFLKLPASLKDDLDWSQEKKRAEAIVEQKKLLLWEIDFQFQAQGLPRFDTSAFFAQVRALEEFIALSSAFSQHTLGVCLYKGGLEFLSFFDHNGWEETWEEWFEELVQESYAGHELRDLTREEREGEWIHTHYVRLFKADIFAAYLHRLISFLPDSMLPFAFFDASAVESSAYAAQLFSKERFKHLHLEVDQNLRTPLALLLPSDPYCDRRILVRLDAAIHSLQGSATLFRIICEEHLTEEWDGLDRLIIIPESISPQGKRKLQGFLAAGGEIIEDCSLIPIVGNKVIF